MPNNQLPFEPPVSKYSSYPKPEADYQQIIQSSDAFLLKLQSFHLFYGTNLRVPTLGGNPLDLHRLFLEVTSRGGIEKVIKDRRWKEVTGAFNFPSTITSASFVLRRYYLQLLYHFEQVYYFRKEQPCISSPDQGSGSANGSPFSFDVDDGAASDQLEAIPNLEDGDFVNGTIDGKFDYGYLVTVNLGAENLKGVLYHTPEGANLPNSLTLTPAAETSHRRQRKHQLARDPAHPKRNRSGYTFFFAEQYHRLRPSYHGQERAISKKIGQLWNRLSEAEKKVYQDKGLRDKERYKAEMQEYKSSQHVGAQ